MSVDKGAGFQRKNKMPHNSKSGHLSKPSLKQKANQDFNFWALLYGHCPFLQECVSLSLKPKQISDQFRTQFSVDIPSKEISDYISYLKKNGEITVPATKDTLAEETLLIMMCQWSYMRKIILLLKFKEARHL